MEAELGAYLFKKRIARPGSGKSGGYRTIIGFRKKDDTRIFFLHGFPKSARSNITRSEHAALSVTAKALINSTDRQIEALKARAAIMELECRE